MVRTRGVVRVGGWAGLGGFSAAEGTRGVVLSGPRGILRQLYLVRISHGGRLVDTWVPCSQLNVVERSVGVDRFERRASRLAAARFGVAVAFVAPILLFAAQHWWRQRTLAGLDAALAGAAIDSLGAFVTFVFDSPGRALVYALVSAAAWRFAFRR